MRRPPPFASQSGADSSGAEAGGAPAPAIPIAAGYGIRAAASLTGVDEHTLRMWERRYGFPRPARTGAGARLYSLDDIRHVRRIAEALKRGHRPGEVVALDEAALDALLLPDPIAAETPGSVPAAAVVADPVAADSGVDAILHSLRKEDVAGVRDGLRRAAVLFGPRRFVTEVAHPIAVRVGELWAAGKLEVHQEHLMSDCLSTQLRLLRSLFDESRGPAVVLATLPGEPHGLGLEMVALFLASGGLSPRVIGVATPSAQIVRAVIAHKAAAVGIAVMPSFDQTEASRELQQIVPALPPATQVWLGGAGATLMPAVTGVQVIADFAALDHAARTLQ